MIRNVLCVDDDDISQFYTNTLIEDAYFIEHADSVYDGQKALQYFQDLIEKKELNHIIPELILLDLNMPKMDGWEFLDLYSIKFSSIFKTIKIAILSSSVNPDDFVKAKNYPFVIDFISKPITIDILKHINDHYFNN